MSCHHMSSYFDVNLIRRALAYILWVVWIITLDYASTIGSKVTLLLVPIFIGYINATGVAFAVQYMRDGTLLLDGGVSPENDDMNNTTYPTTRG